MLDKQGTLSPTVMTGQSCGSCDRAGKCTDIRPFDRWQDATKSVMENSLQLTQNSTTCHCVYRHLNLACPEISTSLYDPQKAEILTNAPDVRLGSFKQSRRIISEYIITEKFRSKCMNIFLNRQH
jgi:hypothetical protein